MSYMVEAPEADGTCAGVAGTHEWPGEIRYVTRQPILDLRGRIHGYEVLFQMGPGRDKVENAQHAARTVLDNMVLFGFDRLTGGLPTFIRCTEETLAEQLVAVLPAQMTVLEIPRGLEMTPKLVSACHRLKDAGFRLALVDFTWDPAQNILLDLCDYVKVDFSETDAPGRQSLRNLLKRTSVAMMAEKVDSPDVFRRAFTEGFTLFQGFYFCNPEPIQNAKAPANRSIHIEILRQLFRTPLDLNELCPLVMRDASLVFRILRLVNSPAYAIRQEVNSIQSAIVILGETAFRRIATLAIQCELNADQPPEILRMALVRARFCELAAPFAKLDPQEQYLLGMLSLLPAMMRVPMQTLIPQLPLRDAIGRALLGDPVGERRMLSWIEALEQCDFAVCHKIAEVCALDHGLMNRLYFDALTWDGATPENFA
ncbi:MAG: EAL and HDOD domain-containing protein [Terracidiphilus sp.]